MSFNVYKNKFYISYNCTLYTIYVKNIYEAHFRVIYIYIKIPGIMSKGSGMPT